jgi:hypothetical protein
VTAAPKHATEGDTLNLGATVLPILARTYWRQGAAVLAVIAVIWWLVSRD